MLDTSSLAECAALHRRAITSYRAKIPQLVNGSRMEAESRLRAHSRSLEAIQAAILELHTANRIAPTLPEAVSYGETLGWDALSVEDWFDYMATFGWRLREGEIKDWKAAMRRAKRGSEKHRTAQRAPREDKDAEPPKWRDFLSYKNERYQTHRLAPGFLRTEFARWKKASACPQ